MLYIGTVFILEKARKVPDVVDGGRKGDPFKTRQKKEKKKQNQNLRRSPIFLPQGASLDFHKIRVGRQGTRGLMGTQQERSWPPPLQAHPSSHHHGD